MYSLCLLETQIYVWQAMTEYEFCVISFLTLLDTNSDGRTKIIQIFKGSLQNLYLLQTIIFILFFVYIYFNFISSF